jgi:hypothetical protein
LKLTTTPVRKVLRSRKERDDRRQAERMNETNREGRNK